MSLKNLKDSELNKLLDEVALDLNKAFGEVQNKLAKGEGKVVEGDESGKMVKEEASEAPAEESSPIPESSESAPAEAAAPVDESAGAPAPEASEAPADPAMDQGQALTPEALQAEYEKLPPEELQMHLQAAQAALAKLSGGMGAGPDAGMAPPAPEASEAPAQAPLMQSEKAAAGDSLKKAEFDALKADNASLKEDVEILAASLKKLIETPVRKAITSISELTKGEVEEAPAGDYQSLAPNEFWAKLKEVSKRPDLKKSEKQLILDVYTKKVDPSVAAKHLVKLFKAE